MEAALLLVSLVPLGCCPMAACCLLETLVLRLSLLELGAHCCAARWMALGVANLALAAVLGAVMCAGGQHHVCGSVTQGAHPCEGHPSENARRPEQRILPLSADSADIE
jgi:hypothetical protein